MSPVRFPTTEVPAALAGARADRVVAALAGVSRARARRLVAEGRARFDGAPADPRRRVPAGTLVEIDLPAEGPALEPERVAFAVLHEDDHLAVIDKPAGIVVHPGAAARRGTLAAGLLHRWPRVRGVGDEGRWGIVHRLDRDTSGLMVVALSAEGYAALRALVAARGIERGYRALAHGVPAAATGTVDAPLGRHPRRHDRVRVDPAGRPARTHFRLLASWPRPALSLLEVRLETGRTHQIRVHLASIGHPVVGDTVYGKGDRIAPRQFLHAAEIGFAHPISGAEVEVRSPLPPDLQSVLGTLGDPAPGGQPG
jgi:23S rRNA pseudouridine1911/1915/1917 synthase